MSRAARRRRLDLIAGLVLASPIVPFAILGALHTLGLIP